MRSLNRPAALLGAALILAACSTPGQSSAPPAMASSGPPGSAPASGATVFPVIVSSEVVVGPNRLLFSFLDASGSKPIAAPDRTASISFTGPGGETIPASQGEFVWAIEGTSGLYVTEADFPVAGSWSAEFTTAAPGSPESKVPFVFDVREEASVVRPGEPAPSVDTPTLEDVGGEVEQISSDEEPEPAFYETSVADALAADEPFVLVFATPAFCQTQTCGPTLEKVKEVAADHPDVTIINVEPYETTYADGQLQPVLDENNLLKPVEASEAYGLVTEPYVFVVDGDGKVAESFELIFTADEIDAALAAVTD
jgi:hypothetical protein